MKDKQNIIIVLLVILIAVVIVEGGIYLYRTSTASRLVVCKPGDSYNIMTGKPCPNSGSLVTTPVTAQ